MVKDSAFQHHTWDDYPSYPPIFVAYTHFQSLLVLYTSSLELGIIYLLFFDYLVNVLLRVHFKLHSLWK